MRKADRQKNTEARKQVIEQYRVQHAAVEGVVTECRNAITKMEFEHHVADVYSDAGNSFHRFDGMIDALGMTATEITPPLRKAIDVVLEAYEIRRNDIANLKALCYDRYWKSQYGYDDYWVWDATPGWYAFGTRRDRFDLDDQGVAAFNSAHPGLEECSQVFLGAFAEQPSVLSGLEYYCSNELIVFTEFLGDHSFARKHLSTDTKRLVIIDVQTANGFLSPAQFAQDLVNLPIARTVYRGKLTGIFADDVREGRFGVAEGVVCKGESDGKVWMAKIKTNAYMQRLKEAFADKWEDYWE